MRIWKGLEQEGQYKGKMTLFIESKTINKRVMTVVDELLKQHLDIKQLYFGAGGVPVSYIDKTLSAQFLKLGLKYLITIEQPISLIEIIPDNMFNNIIGSIYNVKLPTTVKLDTGSQVYSTPIDTFILNDLDTLQEGLYTNTDILLYKGE